MAIGYDPFRRRCHQFGNLLEKGFGGLYVAVLTEPDTEQIAIFIDAPIEITPFPLNLDIGFIHVPDVSERALPFGTHVLSKLSRKALAPLAHRFVSEVKAPQPKQFGHIAIAQFETQTTIEHLENNISGDFDVIERGARAFVEAPLAAAAKMKEIVDAGRLFEADSGVFGLAMGAAHSEEGQQDLSVSIN